MSNSLLITRLFEEVASCISSRNQHLITIVRQNYSQLKVTKIEHIEIFLTE